MKNKKKQGKMFLIDNLPEELKLEILHKLEIKSIGKCMCVSKYWLSLIKNPSFISTHLKLTSHSDNNLLLFRRTNDQFSLHLDNNDFDHYRVLDLPFEARNKEFNESGSCNGIICLVEGLYLSPSELVDKKVVLWNPTIRKILTLPPPNIPFPTLIPLAKNYDDYKVSYGFGFDSLTNDYKLIRVLNSQYSNPEVPTPEAEIFSLNRYSWTTVTHSLPKCNIDMRSFQAFVNGVLHCIGYRRVRTVTEIWCLILGLDMGGEVFSEITLPECMADWNPYDITISAYKESSIGACFLDFVEYKFLEVWVMREYGKVESWTKIWKWKQDGTELSTTLGFRNNGEVFVEEDREITSVDPETEQEMNVGFRGFRNDDCPVSYFVESLVLLDNVNALSYGDIDAMDDYSDDDSNGDASDAFSE